MSQGQIPGFPYQGTPPPTNEPPQATLYLSDGPQQASAIRAGSNPYINRTYEPITTTTQPAPSSPSSWPQSNLATSISQQQSASSSWPPPQPPPSSPIQQTDGRNTKRVRISEPSASSPSTPTVWGATKYGTNKKSTNQTGEPVTANQKSCGCRLKNSVMSMAIVDLIVAIICCIVTIVQLMGFSRQVLFLRTGLGTSVIIILSTIGLLIGAHSRTNVFAVASFVIGWIAFLAAIIVYIITYLIEDPFIGARRWVSLVGMILALVYRIYESVILCRFVNELVHEQEGPGFIDGDSSIQNRGGGGGTSYNYNQGMGYQGGGYPAGTYPGGTYPAGGGYSPQTVVAVPPFGGYDSYDPFYAPGGLGPYGGLGYGGLGYGGLGYGGLGYGYGGLGYDGFYGGGLFDHHHHHHHGLWL